MHLASHKRMKFHHGPPQQVIDYSDVSAISNLLEGLNDGKYGSVTKEYEALHAQRMQVINILSALQPSFTHASGDCGLELQEKSDACPEKKEGDDITSAIIIDSDDEGGDHQVQNRQPSSSEHGTQNFRAWIVSQLQLRLRHNPSAWEGYSNQLAPNEPGNVKFDRDAGIEGNKLPSIQYQKVVLNSVTEKYPIPNLTGRQHNGSISNLHSPTTHLQHSSSNRAASQGRRHRATKRQHNRSISTLHSPTTHLQHISNNTATSQNQKFEVLKGEREGETLHNEVIMEKESDVHSSPISFVGIQDQSQSMITHNQDDTEASESDGLEDLWKDMSLAMECSKGATLSEGSALVQKVEDCSHSFVLEDDLGLVCRVCGVIQRSIDTIFDYQWKKGTQTTRTYVSGSRCFKDVGEVDEYSGSKISEHDFYGADISIHPRHMKQMKPHQIEGFNFLVKNLMADPPGGCILAHAPGSGKTFMLISFIQSFLAKDPHARPLVVLPKGILSTWKKEFQRWQVEDIPIYDFYHSKADNRSQQLDVLNSWHENRSILFLGYKQFSNIVCDGASNKVAAACQEKLLKVPTLLIMDEGHTPRNENTDVLTSIAKVRTPCKVVLSGTLFQNHVNEVFNILKLVRPNFMKTETSRAIIKRVMSKVRIPGSRRPNRGGSETFFYEVVEETLRNDDNYKRKVAVIQDLREMTRDVLHYYKGDFLDELPGLVDFTVLFNLSVKQKEIVQKLGKFDKFKRSSVGSAVYIHPQLMEIAENASGDKKDATCTDRKIDGIIDSINVRDGAKTKFFLNLLSMSESAGEKIIVFSQYLLPMKFLERLIVQLKGWRSGKEIFAISGDSSAEHREWSMEQFNNSPDAKVLFGSIKACGEGISLVGASRILILDVHLNPSVTRQAIGRAFRPGQQKKVYTYRLVAADSPEEEDHNTSFRKELISKMWFEWSEYCGHRDFELDAVDVADSQDVFLESPALGEDIKALYRR